MGNKLEGFQADVFFETKKVELRNRVGVYFEGLKSYLGQIETDINKNIDEYIELIRNNEKLTVLGNCSSILRNDIEKFEQKARKLMLSTEDDLKKARLNIKLVSVDDKGNFNTPMLQKGQMIINKVKIWKLKVRSKKFIRKDAVTRWIWLTS